MIDTLMVMSTFIGVVVMAVFAVFWAAFFVLIALDWVGVHSLPDVGKQHSEPVSGPERDSLNDYVDATDILYHEYDHD